MRTGRPALRPGDPPTDRQREVLDAVFVAGSRAAAARALGVRRQAVVGALADLRRKGFSQPSGLAQMRLGHHLLISDVVQRVRAVVVAAGWRVDPWSEPTTYRPDPCARTPAWIRLPPPEDPEEEDAERRARALADDAVRRCMRFFGDVLRLEDAR